MRNFSFSRFGRTRRFLACLLLAAIIFGGAFAVGEDATVTAYAFDLSFSINQEQADANLNSKMMGYADLMEALSIKGSFYYVPETRYLDLQLELIPRDKNAGSIPLHFYGSMDSVMLSTPVLGNEKIVFSNPSLMEFAFKSYEHLGLKLQYLTMLYPYVHEFGFKNVINSWNKYICTSQKSRKISAKNINSFATDIARLLESDQDLVYYLRALGAGSESDEILQSEAGQIPKYITDTVTGKKLITVQIDKGAETWVSGDETLYTHTWTDAEETVSLDLPVTSGGYVPVFDYYSQTEDEKTDLTLRAGWIMEDEEGNDLLFLKLEAKSFPQVWPSETKASVALTTEGSLLPNFRLEAGLTADDAGNVTISVKNQSDEAKENDLVFLATGTVIPYQVIPGVYSFEEALSCVDILRVNDASLAEFVGKVTKPVIKGFTRFLTGIPATACQSVMDDLTDSGVLGMLLGDN